MTPQRALTVCIGVSDYPMTVLEPGEQPLRFLAKSAGDLHVHFKRLWPSRSSRHRLLVNEIAVLSGVEELVAEEESEYDIAVFYLGGHGRGRDRPFEFLFYGSDPRVAIANAAAIDSLLQRVRATHKVLLLDCCYAGTYLHKGVFPRAIGEGYQLCIASSRSDQKSWEDPHFERSLFADAVMKALTGSTSEPASPKQVIGEFFNEVASDVARHAFALKASVAQEPVWSGAASRPLLLPTIAPAAEGARSMTTFEVLVRRSRQIAVAVVVLGVVAAALTSYATWRPALNAAGKVELRAGPKWLSPLNIGPWQSRVEIEITDSDLRNGEVHANLLDEEGVRIWPGLGRGNVRRWADTFMDDFLNAETKAQWQVHLGYEDALEGLITTTVHMVQRRAVTVPTATQLAAEAKILRPSSAFSDAWKLQWQNNVAPGKCGDVQLSQDESDHLSLYLDLSEASEYVDWLRQLALTARVNDQVGYEEVARLVEMFTAANHLWERQYTSTIAAPGEPLTSARIAARFTERPTPSEVRALGAVATAIMARRSETPGRAA